MSGIKRQSGIESGRDNGVQKGYTSTEALGSPLSDTGIAPFRKS